MVTLIVPEHLNVLFTGRAQLWVLIEVVKNVDLKKQKKAYFISLAHSYFYITHQVSVNCSQHTYCSVIRMLLKIHS